MVKVQIEDRQKRNIGFFDTGDKTFYNSKDAKRGQIFQNPKYLSAIGMSKYVIKKLLKLKCKRWNCLITNFEKEDFNAIIDFNGFLSKSKEVNFKGFLGDPQRILSIGEFQRLYKNQKRLL